MFWIHIAAISFGLIPTACGQLFLIAGAPTPQDSRTFDTVLLQVNDGGVSRLAELPGAEWIALPYEMRNAVILPKDNAMPLTVVDLDKATVVKQCVLPQVKDLRTVDRWVANVPGKGATFQWYLSNIPIESRVMSMILDPSISCDESFSIGAASDIAYLEAHGTSGVAEVGSEEATKGGFDQGWNVMSYPAQTRVLFPTDPVPALLRKDRGRSWIIINNSHALVLGLEGVNHDNSRAMVFRKSDRTWQVLYPPGGAVGNLRGFGRFIAIVESRTKMAVQAQRRNSAIDINDEVRLKEKSAGRAEWRKRDGRRGPAMDEAFESALAVYPGRLHLYDVETKQLRSIATNQGDSEILLVEDDTVYYRVSDRLYSAPIISKGIGAARLLATADEIRDVHWAFIKH